MVGVMNIVLDSVMAVYPDSIGVFSGIGFWGGSLYIISGALSVAASDKLNRCLVKGALVMNIFSAISAGIAVIIFSLDCVIDLRYYFCYDYDYDSESAYSTSTYICQMLRRVLKTRSNGITGVLLLLSILEFIISICVSAFACRAVCNCSSEQVIYIPTSNQLRSVAPVNFIPAPSTQEMPVPQILGQSVMGNKPEERPPAYATVGP
ncbi:hypothetical protein COCON_G00006230 [Conger conger]|uniref:Uncharacterized protein n=1 Tax=Conger conger TaxID=82655 RepID=A0A9Q1E263_CONCO|nr:hypothetical protein COCON_G00006230 [Conger conger]